MRKETVSIFEPGDVVLFQTGENGLKSNIGMILKHKENGNYAHELGYKKCTIWGQPMGNRYAEVTYNRDKDEMYVDIYQKIINNKISSDEFNFEA